MAQVTGKRFFNRSLIIWIITVGLIPPSYFIIREMVVHSDTANLKELIFGSFSDILFSILISAVLFVSNTLVYDYSCKLFPNPSQQMKRLSLFIPIALISSNLLALGISFIFNPWGNSRESVFQLITLITIITLTVSLTMIIIYSIDMWKRSIIEKEVLEKANVRSQLESLRTQINPHFLFNSLNALQSLVETDPQKSKEFIQQLSKVYRYVLEHKDELVVELKDEMNFIESFIYLNKIRFGENLQFTTHLEAQYMHQFIPPLTLQILIENAIKHNIISSEKPLHIQINSNGADGITVTNNLQMRNEKVESTGIGLNNLSERYRLIHDQLPTFQIINNIYIANIPFVKNDINL